MRRQAGEISIAVVCAIVAIVFLGASAVSYFRRNVTRQLESLLFNMQVVDIGEAALAECAQQAAVEELFRRPEVLAKLKAAFTGGAYKGGVLLPAASDITMEPERVRERVRYDPRIRVGSVKVIPVRYLPVGERHNGVLRFVVEVVLKKDDREYRKKIGQDYAFKLWDDIDDGPEVDANGDGVVEGNGIPDVFMSRAPLGKVYP